MSPRLAFATTKRVLQQIRRDRRTVALLIFMPLVLLGLLKWMFVDAPGPLADTFDTIGPRLMGLFPMTLMFVVTSVTTLRERTSGTMERLMASPLRRGDLVLGYALAFGIIATVQAGFVVVFSITALQLTFAGNLWLLGVVIVLDAILGTVLGLAASSLARTEFQAVQMMPAVILPQLLLAGTFLERSLMPKALELLSDVLPLSYAIDAINVLTDDAGGSNIWPQVGILALFIVGALALATLTLRRRTE